MNDSGFKDKIEVTFNHNEKPTRNASNDLSMVKHNVEEKNSSIIHNGILFIKIDGKNKDFEKTMCTISGSQLITINMKNQIEKSLSLTSLSSIQIVDEPKKW